MDAPRSDAPEVGRFSHDLNLEGFRAVREGESEHQILLGQLSVRLGEKFRTTPSPSTKTFWIEVDVTSNKILTAFQTYDEYGMPDGFREALAWFVAHPTSGRAYPVKPIWGLAMGQKGSDFGSRRARDGLRKAGFECADLSECPPLDQPNEPLIEGDERHITRSVRERNPVARALCIEHYRNLNSGKLACLVCDFDFSETYGAIGDGFIHVHHLNPLAEASSLRQVSPEFDLVPVCPNCHGLIHRGNKNRSISEMRQLLKKD